MPLSDYSWGRATIIGYTKDGSHWKRKSDGTVILISKEIMKSDEDAHLRPHPEAYDPFWEYRWHLICEEISKRKKLEDYFNSLSREQLAKLEEVT